MEKKERYRLLLLIVNQKLSAGAQEIFSQKRLPIQYHVYAKGTASGEFADMFGLGGVDKSVLISTLGKGAADEMLSVLREELYLGTPNSGVAFTVALTGSSAGLVSLMKSAEPEEEKTSEGDSMDGKYTMIMALVNQGFSEKVMAAARPAGAGGGTVFHCRRVESEESRQLFGITFQEEREIVLILAKKENKLAIMQAIGEQCGVQSEANGIVISLPVDSVAGLKKTME